MKKRIVLINSVVFLFLAFTVCYSQSGDAFNGYRAGFYKGQALNTTAKSPRKGSVRALRL